MGRGCSQISHVRTDPNSVMAYPEFPFVERWYALGFSALFFLVPGAFRRSPLRDGSPLIGPKCNSRTAWVSPMCHSRDLTDERQTELTPFFIRR